MKGEEEGGGGREGVKGEEGGSEGGREGNHECRVGGIIHT